VPCFLNVAILIVIMLNVTLPKVVAPKQPPIKFLNTCHRSTWAKAARHVIYVGDKVSRL